MKMRKALPREKKELTTEEWNGLSCRDCCHSYEWENKGNDGKMIFCRCDKDAASGYGRWCKFLSARACEHFNSREEGCQN